MSADAPYQGHDNILAARTADLYCVEPRRTIGNRMICNQVIVGDKPAELRAFQLLALAIHEAQERLHPLAVHETQMQVSKQSFLKARVRLTGALLVAAPRALALASCGGLATPLEVIALSARNVFEIWLRLEYILSAEANCQSWREEGLSDQIQVYEAMLTLDGLDASKATIRAEVERVKRHGVRQRLGGGRKPLRTVDLAKTTGHKAEYDGFYKLYSKLVHPSSWSVNWPQAVSSPMYRMALARNVQLYGWNILKAVESAFSISAEECYKAANKRLRALNHAPPETSHTVLN